MSLRQRSRTAIAAVAATMVAAGSLALGASPAAAASDIRLGVLPLTIAGPAQYGVDAGVFAKNGLNASLTIFPSGPAELASLAGGQIDFAYVTAVSAIAARANSNMDIKIVAPADGMSRRDVVRAKTDKNFARVVDQAAVCVSPQSGIKTWKDLPGKVVGIPARGSSSEIGTVAAVMREGGDPAQIKWAQMGLPAMNGALKNGQIDAALTSYPFAAACAAEGNTIIGQPTIQLMPNGGPIMMWVTTAAFAKAYPQVIASFQKSIYQLSSMSKNKATMAKILEASTKLSKQPLDVVLAGKPPYYYDGMTKNDLKIFTDQMYKYGYIKTPLDASGMLLPQYRP